MGYKVYIKDVATKGRFVQWDTKEYESKAQAEKVAAAAKAKFYTGKKQKTFGKGQFDIRSTGAPRQQAFGFGSALGGAGLGFGSAFAKGKKTRWF